MEPHFVHIGDRLVAVHDIKWAGMQKRGDGTEDRDLYIEFISGGWVNIKGETLDNLTSLINKL